MKVYRVAADVNRYQYFLTERQEDHEKLWMDCTPKARFWSPPGVYIYKPRHKAGDFYNFGMDKLITSPRATDVLRMYLEEAGELLPLPYQGQQFTLLNVMVCIDCLDVEKSEELPGYYKTYAFDVNCLAQSPSVLFKIPQRRKGEIFLIEGLRSVEHELRYVATKAGLKGLILTEVWTSEV